MSRGLRKRMTRNLSSGAGMMRGDDRVRGVYHWDPLAVISLEWFQKLHRDRSTGDYSTEAVTDTTGRGRRQRPACSTRACTERSRPAIDGA